VHGRLPGIDDPSDGGRALEDEGRRAGEPDIRDPVGLNIEFDKILRRRFLYDRSGSPI
jgi:hypothetical protein